MADREILSVPAPYAPAVAEAVAGLEGRTGVIRVPVLPPVSPRYSEIHLDGTRAALFHPKGRFPSGSDYQARPAPLHPGTVVEVECPECKGFGGLSMATEHSGGRRIGCEECFYRGRLRFRVVQELTVEPWCVECRFSLAGGRLCKHDYDAPPLCWGYEVEVVV